MNTNARFVAINGRELRALRLSRGWTQTELAKSAGYTERLIRKAEKGGTLDFNTILNLAEALSTPEMAVPVESLTIDTAAIARKWVETFDTLHRGMLSEIEPFLAKDFVFVCPGDPGMAPFVGTWTGVDGLRQWLDAFFGFFEECRNTEMEYFIGEDKVHARWVTHCKLQGVACDPVRINMHFRFVDGLIARIDDDYDTHGGVVAIEVAKTTLKEDTPQEG